MLSITVAQDLDTVLDRDSSKPKASGHSEERKKAIYLPGIQIPVGRSMISNIR